MARVLIGWTDAHYMADRAGNPVPNVVLDVQVLGTGAAVTDLQPPTEYAGEAFPTGQARSDAAGYYGFTVPEGTPPVRVRAAARVVLGKTVPAGPWLTPSGQVLVDGPVKAAVAALEATLPGTYVPRSGVWQAVPLVHEASEKAIHDAQNPQAVYDSVSNRTYLAYTGERRDFYVTYFDHATKTTANPVKVTGFTVTSDDDHSVPTIFVDKDGYICVAVGHHDGQFKWAKSTAPRSIAAWSVRNLAEIPSGTYLMSAYHAASHTIYLAYRSGTAHGGATAVYPAHEFAALVKSTDGGVTFTDIGPAIDTRLADSLAQHDAYIMDLDVDSLGRVHMTWLIASGTGHDGIRRNVHHAYYNPADDHFYTMGGTDLGTTVTDFTASRVATVEWCNSPRMLLQDDGGVLISYVAATPSTSQAVVNTTLSVAMATNATTISHVAKPTYTNSSKMVVGAGGTQETLWAVGEPSGSSGNYTTTFCTGNLPRNLYAHSLGEAVAITPMVIGTFVARWTGAAWSVTDTGARTNHLYAVPCLRQDEAGGVDLYTTTGGADQRSTIIYAINEAIIMAGCGGDLSRLTSSNDGATWADQGVIVPMYGVVGQGISLTSPVLNGHPDIKVIAQSGMMVGAATWRLPIYGVSDNLADAKVGMWAASRGALVVPTTQQPSVTSAVPSTGVWQQSFNLPQYVPRKATSVLLRVLGYGDGTVGELQIAFRAYGSGRSQDIEFNVDRARTAQWQSGLVEVALMNGMFEYKQTGGLAGIRIIVVGFRLD